MIVALPLQTDRADSPLETLFEHAKHFALVNDEGSVTVETIEQHGGRDIARVLVARDVDTLIAFYVGLEAFIILKTYGINVYYGTHEITALNDALIALHENSLIEVTAENYKTIFTEEDTKSLSNFQTQPCSSRHAHG
ncbi:hypothetical protein Sulku_2005 [Sulfuricurvum kujiense DSM 16994]|uniref:Dinitrogenase iron-molybdenum cofactor biosynthesis domain-containing protein n=1 Tax=Sulfuricurvum kujiense (strain ATCC BAA-921 / DSM 16994 / JCM 11577 / YK-1) TaxID=709032 RepID=E4U2H8_SULKY|nr:NifB/NifX family molybdenum-iron cluster-binding protein [Sulfuricurvum kujiense]ADR34665.1 hypothetical protein Sulku_2005 [Sulfuricurvum kujiense DSM 16994]